MKAKNKLNESQTKKGEASTMERHCLSLSASNDMFLNNADLSWVPAIIASKRSSTLDDIYLALLLSIKNILNELRTTTNDLIEYNNGDEIVLWKKGNAMMDFKKQDKIHHDWKIFEEEIKSWTDLLKLKIRRYEDLKYEIITNEANPNKWLSARGRFHEQLFWLTETLKVDVIQCKRQLKEIHEDFRLMETGEAMKPEKSDKSMKGFLQKEENQMNNILLEKESVYNDMIVATDNEISADYQCAYKIKSNRKSADKKRSQVCRPESWEDRKPSAKKR